MAYYEAAYIPTTFERTKQGTHDEMLMVTVMSCKMAPGARKFDVTLDLGQLHSRSMM